MTDEQLIAKIEAVLELVRPNIQMDGGDVEFVKVEDGVVYIRFLGACVGCPISQYTLKAGIEQTLKEQIDQIHEVVLVHD